jgi:hypothetical protein
MEFLMEKSQEIIEEYLKSIKHFLSAFEKILRLRIDSNKMSGNQGKAAKLRELIADMDSYAANKLNRAINAWPHLKVTAKLAYYHQAIKYINKMIELENIALGKLYDLRKKSQDRGNTATPEVIDLILKTHTDLLEISLGMRAIISRLEAHKPTDAIAPLEIQSQIQFIIDNQKEKLVRHPDAVQRRTLVAKL